MLEQIKSWVKNNTVAINRLAEHVSVKVTSDESVEDFGFPLNTVEDVERVESLLDDKEKFQLLVSKTIRMNNY